jgi:hypothetical protein
MAGQYLQAHFTPQVLAAQKNQHGAVQRISPQPEQDFLTENEIDFIASRGSFYLATVTSNG